VQTPRRRLVLRASASLAAGRACGSARCCCRPAAAPRCAGLRSPPVLSASVRGDNPISDPAACCFPRATRASETPSTRFAMGSSASMATAKGNVRCVCVLLAPGARANAGELVSVSQKPPSSVLPGLSRATLVAIHHVARVALPLMFPLAVDVARRPNHTFALHDRQQASGGTGQATKGLAAPHDYGQVVLQRGRK
jgi:hypothetical protein